MVEAPKSERFVSDCPGMGAFGDRNSTPGMSEAALSDRLSCTCRTTTFKKRMARRLLYGQHSRGGRLLNSQTGVAGAIHNTETQSLPYIESACAKTILGGAFAETGPHGGPKTILLVEDEAFVRRATAEVLESAGYSVLSAGSAGDALEACRKRLEPVDLLLADVVMPGMSGRELAAEFKSCCPGAQVLLMSGYPEQLALCELSTSEKKYLAKPFSVGMLLQRVHEVLEMKLLELEVRP